jgi:hypothetical protein
MTLMRLGEWIKGNYVLQPGISVNELQISHFSNLHQNARFQFLNIILSVQSTANTPICP